MKQSELVKQLSDQELKKSLYMSQLFILILAFIASLFLFGEQKEWMLYFHFDMTEIVKIGFVSGIAIVLLDFFLMFIFPKRFYDDGGINERIFKSLTVREILFICVIIALSEELLFRGVLQTTFGYIIASIIFAFVHIRYLTKPVLFISVLFVSFFIGYLFEITGNLYVTMVAHFTIDFTLGMTIHFQKRGVYYE